MAIIHSIMRKQKQTGMMERTICHHFSSKLTWKSKKEPVFDRKFCLNGQEIDQKQGLVNYQPPLNLNRNSISLPQNMAQMQKRTKLKKKQIILKNIDPFQKERTKFVLQNVFCLQKIKIFLIVEIVILFLIAFIYKILIDVS